jgi:RNase H-fold protein (predicted Holliday junction resolvase)
VVEQARQSKPILAVDPGTGKCGVALVMPDGKAVRQAVTSTDRLSELVREWDASELTAVVGKGTGHQQAVAALREAGVKRIELVEEKGTSLLARQLYWEAHPPRGWRRLIPRGFLIPPTPVDDWAAVALGRAWLARRT